MKIEFPDFMGPKLQDLALNNGYTSVANFIAAAVFEKEDMINLKEEGYEIWLTKNSIMEKEFRTIHNSWAEAFMCKLAMKNNKK